MASEIEKLFRQLEPAPSIAADVAQLRKVAEDEPALARIAGKAFAAAARQAALNLAARIERLASRLEPGTHPTDPSGKERAPSELKPCGQCDAVVFLDGIKNVQNVTVIESPRVEALRYLAPVPDGFKAILGHSPKWLGISEPKGLESEIAWMVPLDKLAQASGRRLRTHFTFSERGVNAIQPEHAPRWRCYQVRPDIWAVLYVDDGSAAQTSAPLPAPEPSGVKVTYEEAPQA